MTSRRALLPALNPLRQTVARSSQARLRLLDTASRPLRISARQAAPLIIPIGIRRYSQSVADSKIWDFEGIRKLTQDPKPNVTIVDVREPGELKSTGRVPGAINIPVTSAPDSFHITDEEFEDRFGYPRPGRDQEVIFYCKAGVRSRAAAGLAKEAGWVRVGEYPGSWVDWDGKGGKIER